MSTTADRVPTAVLRISEAASLAPGGAVAEDGTVTLHLIRPCLGKGRGRHVYEADMLRRHAESGHFNDWPMFVDHESPEARRKAGGLPRSFGDLGGRVVETWWDDSVPAEGAFGKGAVAAKALPVPWIQEYLRNDPKLGQVSLNTHATGVQPTTRQGRPAYIVEGFEHEGSVDWVTRAGAGGRVVQLMEAAYDEGRDEAAVRQLMEAMPDDRVAAWIRDERPAVAEALNADHGEHEEDDDVTVKPEDIQEAVSETLRSDDGKAVLAEAIRESASEVITETVKDVLPTALGAAAGVIEQQAVAAADMAVRRGAMRTKGEAAVQEAKLGDGSELPEKFRGLALTRITEAANSLEDKTETEGDGDDAVTKVTETAETQFDAEVEAAITEARELVESVKPRPAKPRRARTAVTENGTGSGDHDDDDAIVEAEEEPVAYREVLESAGVDMEAAYGVKPKGDPEPDKNKDGKTEDETAAAATA
jgi:hypothetical protein